ncbi:MAG TPA: glycosyltransferase family 2 protein, partial [Ignavibacteriaceae bacterium]|nr:glycosyltransferase family 2 protein [Ignavibacteriaceae bacterium]
MNPAEKIERQKIQLDSTLYAQGNRNVSRHYVPRIIISGLLTAVFLLILIYTLPVTLNSITKLLEYSVSAALVIFLIVLLLRYLIILLMAYLNLNKHTFQISGDYSPFVSIIIPVYNEENLLGNSINSLLNLNYKFYEIIIVNDGSTDRTQAIAESFVGYRSGIYNEVKISLINKRNEGKASALNAGIKFSNSEFILCVDGDSQLSPDSLKLAVRHLLNPSIGAVSGNVKVLNRGRLLTDLQALEYLEGLNLTRSAQSFVKLVNIIPGPLGLFRRKVIEQAGFYSSDTFAEDADITLKILSKGWKVSYEPYAVSYTEAPTSLNQLLKQRYRWTRGIIQSLKKNKKDLLKRASFGNLMVLSTMLYEVIIWPVMNISANLSFIAAAFFFGYVSLIFFWWAALTLLDFIAALYCIASEKEEVRLAFYSVIYRIFFILIVDVCKTISS